MATPNSDVLHSVTQLPALIISGGQRGADYGGLLAAQSLDIGIEQFTYKLIRSIFLDEGA